MRLFKHLILASTVMSSLGIGAQAFAQTTAPAKAAAPAEEITEVVVTGSHLRRKDLNTASPVTTITAKDAELAGKGSAAELLQKIPQAASSSQTNTLLGGYVVTGGSGVETISLYGLGAQNTLVLLNGRRMGPAGVGPTLSAVDLNVLPLDAFKQIDIVLDGSSSIYGSDAVGGVINFITKKNTDGVDLIVHGNVPFKGNGSTYTATVAGGKTFDKGYISLLGSYHTETGLTLKDRKNTGCSQNVYFDPTTGARSDFLGTDGNYKCFNLLNNGFQGNGFGGIFQYDPTHTIYPNVPAAGRAAYLPDWVRAGRSGQPATYPYQNTTSEKQGDNTLIQPVKTASILITGGYDLSSTASLYGELLYNNRTSSNHGVYQLFPWVEPTNPQNTVAAALYGALPSSGGYARPIIAYDNFTRTNVDYLRTVVGINGTIDGLGFLNGFNYDTNYQLSVSDASYGQTFIYSDRVDATTAPGVSCDASYITTAASCVTIPWFSADVLAGKFTDAQSKFLFGYETGKTKYLSQSFESNITGDLFRLPAGAVSGVMGVYFENQQEIDTPGINAQNNNYWGFSTSGITKGQYTSEQAYAEFYAPLVKNVFLVKHLDVTLSGRYSNYSSSGSNSTYKLGAVWNITNEYAFTATHGTSYRAPTIYEAHLADQSGFVNLSDPCANWGDSTNADIQARCKAEGIPSTYSGALQSATVYTGGGAALKPETATNTNYGFAWTPAFADLKVTVNYNIIKDHNKIDKFGSQSIVNACYGGRTYPSFYCTLFQRDANHDIVVVHDNYINIASVENENVGLKIDYRKKFNFGRLSIFSDTSWQIKNEQTLGDIVTDYTGSVGSPVFSNQTSVNFTNGDWTYHWGFDVIGKTSDLRFLNYSDVQPATANYPSGYRVIAGTPVYQIHNFALTRQFDKVRVTFGINNFWNKEAPTLSSYSGAFRVGTAALNAYDLLGRTAYFTIDKRF